jgi:putative ABC transport system permease protein
MRSVITIGSISFGMTAIIFVGGFFEDMYTKLREQIIFAQSGHLKLTRIGFAEKGALDPYSYLIEGYRPILSEIERINGVILTEPRLEFGGLIGNGEESSSCLVYGVDPLADNRRRELAAAKGLDMKSSGDILAADAPQGVMLGEQLAASMDFNVGDGLILIGRTVDQSINGMDISVRGIFNSALPHLNNYGVVLPLNSAQKILRTDSVQELIVYLDDTRKTDAIKAELEALIKKNNWGLEVQTWRGANDFYEKTTAMFSRWYNVIRLVIIVIVILTISNTMNMSVLERVSEFGTLRALGSQQGRILQIVVIEGAMVGFIGGVSGLVAGSAFVRLIAAIGIPMPVTPGISSSWVSEPVLVGSALGFSFFVALLTSIVSSYLPARHAARLEISQALRHLN